ncbi:MAG TPA: hypothetical protein DGH68_02325 [Bacteroidetes bacterium]|jgi:hypothetical protein|nr:hypothetical protein [Bacteroidota bacterium]
MKATTAIALGLALAASTALSQGTLQQAADDWPYSPTAASYGTANLTQAKKVFQWSLESDNDGVVESVLGHIAHMRITLPQEAMKDIEAAVRELANNGRTPVIRYKAYLASLVFDNPSMFCQTVTNKYASSDELFGAIATRVQQTMLSSTVQ